jgi:hypothetical protein
MSRACRTLRDPAMPGSGYSDGIGGEKWHHASHQVSSGAESRSALVAFDGGPYPCSVLTRSKLRRLSCFEAYCLPFSHRLYPAFTHQPTCRVVGVRGFTRAQMRVRWPTHQPLRFLVRRMQIIIVWLRRRLGLPRHPSSSAALPLTRPIRLSPRPRPRHGRLARRAAVRRDFSGRDLAAPACDRTRT